MAQTQNPKLQQRARLLGLSSTDLLSEIHEALESNVMLEFHDDATDDGSPDIDRKSTENTEQESVYERDLGNRGDAKETPNIFYGSSTKPPTQNKSEDIYDRSTSKTGLSQLDAMEDEVERIAVESSSLVQHLLRQLELIPLTDMRRVIAEAIIHSLDDSGRLKISAEELCKTVLHSGKVKFRTAEVESVLEIIQDLDPAGVAARDLHECFFLQLSRLPEGTPWLLQARLCCSEFMDTTFLKPKYHEQLMRRLNIGREALEHVIDLIRSMNPHPCSRYSSNRPEYVIPEVFVYKEKGQWTVELELGKTVPQLRVNTLYETALKTAGNLQVNQQLRAQLRDAKEFLKNLECRQETLLRVSEAIMEAQKAFLEQGEEAMKPLKLADIADKTDLSISWISRATTRKYIRTPKGIYPLKFFFSNPIRTFSGENISSTAIRAKIKQTILKEDAKKPLSDKRIADSLSGGGIRVARRTVAKYRERMKIPSSNERKRID